MGQLQAGKVSTLFPANVKDVYSFSERRNEFTKRRARPNVKVNI